MDDNDKLSSVSTDKNIAVTNMMYSNAAINKVAKSNHPDKDLSDDSSKLSNRAINNLAISNANIEKVQAKKTAEQK